ncbi:hypothetical protein MLD38_010306 [Melastoma candidum]|uniref:Uncharacterized protein n=1 Tax=Melastoma candidum TaxID=119954 RepID=A0ACB9R2Y4_9MYRT|nr:hypothetical protein MLD38_010306 [Melastoma candidum]
MASAAIFASIRRRRFPCLEAFVAPVDLAEVALLQVLGSLSRELVSGFPSNALRFQRKNFQSLLRKVEFFCVLIECLNDRALESLPSTAVLCFKELYLLLYRSKVLLDYCFESSKLWLLLQNHTISGHFYDLDQEICTLLDVFPIRDVELSEDIGEQLELLRRQSGMAKFYMDKHDEELRFKLFALLDEFEKGQTPKPIDLQAFFVDRLGIKDASGFRSEIEFLEEQLMSCEGEVEPPCSVLNGFMALTRYCRFLLCGFKEGDGDCILCNDCSRKMRKGPITREIVKTFTAIPKDFCCPISLELMRDPGIISTGQTYERKSILRWMEEGHCTCPKTGQMLTSTSIVPNRVLRNLIMQWCTAHGIAYDPLEPSDASSESFPAASPSKAALEANKATAAILVRQLASGSQGAKTMAAKEIRLLAKTGRENRAFIAEAGAIPYLCELLSSTSAITQEISVTAMLNLSIHDRNKSRIMEEKGCLQLIVKVLEFGGTTEARENAAATLFSLSAIHDYKKRIVDERGAVEALADLLRRGSARGKKDAVTALFNLSTHNENCSRMIEAGAISALVGALINEAVAEESTGALALIVRKPRGVEAVAKEEAAVSGLLGVMRCGTPRGKENAVATLLELCRSGGDAAADRILRAPALAGLLQSLLFTGTKRARRKAASLARAFQRCENVSLHFGGLGVGYTLAGNSAANMDTTFVSDVSVQMSISVPVL